MNGRANRDAPPLDLLRLTWSLSAQHRIVVFSGDNCCSTVEQFSGSTGPLAVLRPFNGVSSSNIEQRHLREEQATHERFALSLWILQRFPLPSQMCY